MQLKLHITISLPKPIYPEFDSMFILVTNYINGRMDLYTKFIKI